LNSYQENPIVFSLISLVILASDVVLPIPSTIVMYLNGYVMGIVGGFLLSLSSLMISSLIGFYIGKRFSRRDQSPSFSRFFHRYGFASIILTRGIPILAEAISIVGGYTQMSLRKFTLYHIIGYLPVCFIYAYLGKYAKEEDAFITVLLVSVGITILFWLYGWLLDKWGNHPNVSPLSEKTEPN